MKKDLPIGFVVIIFDDESIRTIEESIRTDVAVDLLENTESLRDIHTGLSDDVRMMVKCLPSELYFLTALVVEHHFKGSILPVPCHQQVVLSWLKQAADPYDLFLLVFTSNPPISIATISSH